VSWWVLVCAAAFLGYFALLIYCDVRRPESEGVSLRSGRLGLVVEHVAPSSPAERAGLVSGDEILSADRHPTSSRVAWMAVSANLHFDHSLQLEVLRRDRRMAIAVEIVPASWRHWLTREAIYLLSVRLVQALALALGLVVALRRPKATDALIGAWLLLTFGVYCVVLPYRIAAVWRELPAAIGWAMWLPYLSTLALPAVLLGFFISFPIRRIRAWWHWCFIAVPMAVPVGVHARYQWHVVYGVGVEPLPPDGLDWLVGVSIAYLAAVALAVVANYRRAEAAEQRRLRVLLLGPVVGCLAGGPIVLSYWRASEPGLFASPVLAIAALLLLTVPLSFAYAVLRHRLFDVRLIVRAGVRYALARRLLLSIVPGLAVVLAVDVYLHRDRAVSDLVGARASLYLVIAGVAVLAQFCRQRWLDALDRRFFRERFDAQRLLRRVAVEVREAPDFERAAARVVEQIELALHPRFVAVLRRQDVQEAFEQVAEKPAGTGPLGIPASAKVFGLARVLGTPLDVSIDRTEWLSEHLPPEETALVQGTGVELIVPIVGRGEDTDAFLVLGPRRSEDPYGADDREWLAEVAESLADLAGRQRAAPPAPTFRECPRCGACFDAGAEACAQDGGELTIVRLPRDLAGRYRLDRRLGRGGMGVVYGASDLSLGREVAVKLLRDDLVPDPGAAARFEREARISASFTHPHVVTIYDFGVVAGTRAFLVMERLAGLTLREELERNGRIDPQRALTIMRAICSAVDAAHRHHLVHRDLKPENVFLAQLEGLEHPKVLDFGIAKALPANRDAATGLTTVGGPIGTLQYMAPEQLRGEDPQPSWDLWALAVTTYEMLTGRHPFAALSLGLSAGVHPAADVRVSMQPASGLDVRWAPFFEHWLAIDADRRTGSAWQFLSELEDASRRG
jgi:tRNA A-37 threonylcarbamoyl transferase component Bud32